MTIQHLIDQARRTASHVREGRESNYTTAEALAFTLDACAYELARLRAKVVPRDDEECPVCHRLPCVRLADCERVADGPSGSLGSGDESLVVLGQGVGA